MYHWHCSNPHLHPLQTSPGGGGDDDVDVVVALARTWDECGETRVVSVSDAAIDGGPASIPQHPQTYHSRCRETW